MHCLAAITVSIRLHLIQAQIHTPTHACIASQQSITVTHVPYTQTSTRMHRLAAITVCMRPAQAQTHSQAHTCIASQDGHEHWSYSPRKKEKNIHLQIFMYTALGVYECQELHNTKKGACLPDVPPAAGDAASQKQGSQTSAEQGWYMVLQQQ